MHGGASALSINIHRLPSTVQLGAWQRCQIFVADYNGELQVGRLAKDTAIVVEAVPSSRARYSLEMRADAGSTASSIVPNSKNEHIVRLLPSGLASFDFRFVSESTQAEIDARACLALRLRPAVPNKFTLDPQQTAPLPPCLSRSALRSVLSLPFHVVLADPEPANDKNASIVACYYSPPLNLSQCREYFVPGLASPLLIAEQSCIAGRVWAAAWVLLHHLVIEPNLLCSGRILELGCGTGFLSIAYGMLLTSRSTSGREGGTRIFATDVNAALPLVCANVALNRADYVQAVELEWGGTNAESRFGGPLDVVLLAEVAYMPEYVRALAQTLKGLCGPHTLVLHAYRERGSAIHTFRREMAAQGFLNEKMAEYDNDGMGLVQLWQHLPPSSNRISGGTTIDGQRKNVDGYDRLPGSEETGDDGFGCARPSTAPSGVDSLLKEAAASCDDIDVGLTLGRFDDMDAAAKRTTAEYLSKIAKEGDPQAIAAMRSHLQHEDADVRFAVLSALAKATYDIIPFDALSACLADSDARVRFVILEVFANLSERNHEHAAQALVACLYHENESTCCAARNHLKQLVARGNTCIISELCNKLDHPSSDVKCAALQALSDMKEAGESALVSAVVNCLEDADANVRSASVRALSKVAVKGDETVITAACMLLESESTDLRKVAIAALAEVTEKGNEKAIIAVSACLKHSNAAVRCSALEALGTVAKWGDEIARSAMSGKLQDADADVRRAAAILVLSQVPLDRKGDLHAIAAVGVCLADGPSEVRDAVVAALAQVASRGDKFAVATMSGHLMSADAIVRSIAMAALGKVLEIGDDCAISVVSSHLQDVSEHVRCATVRTLAQIAGRGNEDALVAVKDMLNDPSSLVRCAAVDAVMVLAESGDAHSIAAISMCLKDKDGDVRHVAAKAVCSKAPTI